MQDVIANIPREGRGGKVNSARHKDQRGVNACLKVRVSSCCGYVCQDTISQEAEGADTRPAGNAGKV